ncbi:MAG: hypothetical protein AB7O57_00950 [Hyphomicrobiaceae bacterium]
MKRVLVLAFEDRSRPEGGHVALLLLGVRKLPSSARIELRLVGTDGGPASEGTSVEPISCGLTEDGLELKLGPEVTELPALMAGASVEVRLPALGLRGELSWPHVTPLRGSPARLRIVERAAAGSSEGTTEVAGSDEATTATAAGHASIHGFDASPARCQSALEFAGPQGSPKVTARFAARTAIRLQTDAAPAMAAGVVSWKAMPISADGTPDEVGRGRSSRPPLGGNWAGFASLVVAGVLLLQAAIWMAVLGESVPLAERAAPLDSAPAELAASPDGTGEPNVFPSEALYELLAARETLSPSGLQAAGVDAGQALLLASRSLHGPTPLRDTAEGIFWLRHHLAQSSGGPKTARALTELGSAYAAPSLGKPNYAQAHRAWQLAAAWGDPVAMCLLAALHAGGLGAAADQDAADRWRSRARKAGRRCDAVTVGAPRS